jgi:hypothetical protein
MNNYLKANKSDNRGIIRLSILPGTFAKAIVLKARNVF